MLKRRRQRSFGSVLSEELPVEVATEPLSETNRYVLKELQEVQSKERRFEAGEKVPLGASRKSLLCGGLGRAGMGHKAYSIYCIGYIYTLSIIIIH